jgi:hypothetical protein
VHSFGPHALDPGILDHIVEHGCSIICSPPTPDGPAVAATVGLLMNGIGPEVLISGLPDDRAHELLNMLMLACRQGLAPRAGSAYEGILQPPLRLAFRPVTPEHFPVYFSHASQLYGPDFAALQAYWPDQAGRFPWDPSCDPHVASVQPRLDHPWPFRGEPVTRRAWTTHPLARGESPITRVLHEKNGTWQFLGESPLVDADVTMITLAAALRLDPGLRTVATLPRGWMAVREGDSWRMVPDE